MGLKPPVKKPPGGFNSCSSLVSLASTSSESSLPTKLQHDSNNSDYWSCGGGDVLQQQNPRHRRHRCYGDTIDHSCHTILAKTTMPPTGSSSPARSTTDDHEQEPAEDDSPLFGFKSLFLQRNMASKIFVTAPFVFRHQQVKMSCASVPS